VRGRWNRAIHHCNAIRHCEEPLRRSNPVLA
jgi:hypothetical protein